MSPCPDCRAGRAGYRQARELLKWCAARALLEPNIVICGDFNASADSPLVRLVCGAGYRDAYAGAPQATCNANRRAVRIDYIFGSPGFGSTPHVNASILSFFGAMLSGSCQVQTDRFSPSLWWKEIASSRATVVHYLGVIVPMLMSLPPEPLERLHQVRFGFGAGVEPQLHATFEERFGSDRVGVARSGAPGCGSKARNGRADALINHCAKRTELGDCEAPSWFVCRRRTIVSFAATTPQGISPLFRRHQHRRLRHSQPILRSQR